MKKFGLGWQIGGCKSRYYGQIRDQGTTGQIREKSEINAWFNDGSLVEKVAAGA
jgi:hypothetical protein